MSKSAKPETLADIELYPDSWERFERAVDACVSHAPMPAKTIPRKRTAKPKSADQESSGPSRSR
jgi:hypothetical protein